MRLKNGATMALTSSRFSRQAAILQQTADYIFALEQEKTQLLAQNNQLKRFIQVTASVSAGGLLPCRWLG